MFKVKTGTIKTDDALLNVRAGEVERFSHLYVLSGKEQKEVAALYPGDIGAVAKLKTPRTGDTMADKDFAYQYEPMVFPKGLVKKAIFPTGKGDEEKCLAA